MNLNNDAYIRLLDNLYDGLYFTNQEGKIVYWNQAAERISGFTADDVIVKVVQTTFLPMWTPTANPSVI